MAKDKSFIVRFTDAALQPKDVLDDDRHHVRRVVGTVALQHILPLFDRHSLDPNPRSARVNRVTEEILRTLETSPELFHYKSKGILLGTANYEVLQRNRFRLAFSDSEIEGILDGGHNMLALGLHLLKDSLDDKEWKRVKSWDDLMEIWPDHAEDASEVAKDSSAEVPIELLIPARDDEDTIEAFHSALIDICSARNNNAQLPQEAAANKKGFYDEMKSRFPKSFADRVEWRPNTWEDEDEKRPVKVRDLISLAWIPLNLLNQHEALPIDISVTPQNIYRNKGECSKQFDRLMGHKEVTEIQDASKHVLIHDGVASAFEVLSSLPELYDQVYEDFPEAYNNHNKRFRSNPIVKQYDPAGRKAARAAGKDISGFIASHPLTPFMRREVTAPGTSKPCSYPDGLIMPMIYGLQGLMHVVDGKVAWRMDNPSNFVKDALSEIAGMYQLVLEMGKWDPQKIAKNPASHEFAVQQFKSIVQMKS